MKTLVHTRLLKFCEKHFDVIRWQYEYIKKSTKERIGYYERGELEKVYEEVIKEHQSK